MIRSIARAIAGSVSTPITGSGPSQPQAPIIASVTISGGTLVGSVLSSSILYTQAPIPAGTVTYQWDRNGSPISGATSASYTLVEADAGAAITLDVSVTNSEGSDSATSNTINAAALAAPSITGVPTISGTLYEGNTLTATAASVTGNPTPATTWQWERDGTPISGATSSTYTLVSADGNADITVVQTETNSQGSDTAESAASTIEAGPVISGSPTISGTETVGSTLTATAASVTGTPTPTRTWQWQRSADGSTGWANISGATSATYTLVSADENEYVRAVQTETNSEGVATATSAATGQIAAAPAFTQYAANSFEPAFVVDETVTAAPYYRSGGSTVGYSDIYTTDTTAGGLCTQNDSSGNLVWGPHNVAPQSADLSSGYSADLSSNAIVTQNVVEITATNGYGYKRLAQTLPVGSSWTLELDITADAAATDVGFRLADNFGTDSASALHDFSLGVTKRVTLQLNDVAGGTSPIAFGIDTRSAVIPGAGDQTGITFTLTKVAIYRSDLGGMADVPSDQRAAAALTKYVATTTTAKYLIRRRHYRYNGTSYVPTLLHEPVGATNLLQYSNDFSQWTISVTDSLTITTDQGAGPDGNLSLDLLEITDTTTEGHGVFRSETISAGTSYVASGYVRDDDQRYIALRFYISAANWGVAVFDLQSGTVTQSSDSGTVTLSDSGIELEASGLYRIWLVASESTATTAFVSVDFASNGTPTLGTQGIEAYSGTAGVGLFAGFLDLVAGSVPSSHIPTTGASVTRSADTCKVKAAALPYDSTAMSIALAGRLSAADWTNSQRLFDWRQDSANRILLAANPSGNARIFHRSGGTINQAEAGALTAGVLSAVSIAARVVASSEIQAALAGAAGTADAIATAIPPLADDDASIFVGGDATVPVNGEMDTLILWSDDVGTAGIEEATA